MMGRSRQRGSTSISAQEISLECSAWHQTVAWTDIRRIGIYNHHCRVNVSCS